MYFDSNFIEICSQGSKWYSSIGSDNALAPNRQQAIIWSNDGLVYWCIYASLGLNELSQYAVEFCPRISIVSVSGLVTVSSKPPLGILLIKKGMFD